MLKLNNIIFCPFHKLTGLFCPGCGITRMLISMFKGEFYQAFRYNPLVFITLPIFIFYFIDLLLSKIRKKPALCSKIPNWIWIILIIGFLVYGLIRNIELFDYLKPTKITLGK